MVPNRLAANEFLIFVRTQHATSVPAKIKAL